MGAISAAVDEPARPLIARVTKPTLVLLPRG
jgi:hypothetical protein